MICAITEYTCQLLFDYSTLCKEILFSFILLYNAYFKGILLRHLLHTDTGFHIPVHIINKSISSHSDIIQRAKIFSENEQVVSPNSALVHPTDSCLALSSFFLMLNATTSKCNEDYLLPLIFWLLAERDVNCCILFSMYVALYCELAAVVPLIYSAIIVVITFFLYY